MTTLYDRIGKAYDRTRSADPDLVEQMVDLLDIQDDGRYLDIGCGTGNYTVALSRRGGNWIGIDPSEEMLDKARQRSTDIDWRVGHVEATGLDDRSMDGIVGSLTIHHWPDLPNAFAELARILRPEGRLVLFTSTPEQMKGYWLGHYFPQMMADSMERMPSLDAVEMAMQAAGLSLVKLEPYEVLPELQDHFLYCGKHMPEMYLDPDIRAGISSFSTLALQSEVVKGLETLEQDLKSGRIWEIIPAYVHELGDYLFLQAKHTPS
ncbi:MAG: class I SAM-dependent methyltransferase [Saprospiraceae bacterium]|nr:class I SAM-dependent methyltransferase [Saprospiraceae bacterium]